MGRSQCSRGVRLFSLWVNGITINGYSKLITNGIVQSCSKHHSFMGKSTIAMAMFNSKLLVYQRVILFQWPKSEILLVIDVDPWPCLFPASRVRSPETWRIPTFVQSIQELIKFHLLRETKGIETLTPQYASINEEWPSEVGMGRFLAWLTTMLLNQFFPSLSLTKSPLSVSNHPVFRWNAYSLFGASNSCNSKHLKTQHVWPQIGWRYFWLMITPLVDHQAIQQPELRTHVLRTALVAGMIFGRKI